MKVSVDTNVLIRAVVRDDKRQTQAVARLLKNSDMVAITLPCLCEFVWVLRKVYGFGRQEIAAAIQVLVNAANIQVNRPAVDAGLAVLNAGGDFADGVIAHEGNWLGAETFVSFDEDAVAILAKQGVLTRLLR